MRPLSKLLHIPFLLALFSISLKPKACIILIFCCVPNICLELPFLSCYCKIISGVRSNIKSQISSFRVNSIVMNTSQDRDKLLTTGHFSISPTTIKWWTKLLIDSHLFSSRAIPLFTLKFLYKELNVVYTSFKVSG